MQIHLAYPLECADEEGVDRHQFPGVVNLNLAFAKLGAEALEQADLLVIGSIVCSLWVFSRRNKRSCLESKS
ncbi:hypothetical protein KAM339_016580 [Aeromonas caviae]|nr:hypothetical protein KAM339_016580 [Aeromonas caviae]